MAPSTTQKRNSAARRARPATPTRAAKKVATKGATKAAKAALPSASPARSRKSATNGLAKATAKQALRMAVRKSAQSGARLVRQTADQAAIAGRNAIEAGANHRFLPIQLSIDVAVPPHIAWQEWLVFGSLPEGIHRIEHVERDGDGLLGRGPRGMDWEAEITDERQDESFAWRSIEGSDCAGLVTFHQLSDRLTRIELDLDVVPTKPSEAMTLALHVAHRRAEADLRRFKAHVEFINPDAYDSNGHQNGRNSTDPEKTNSEGTAEDDQ